jgi:hypothetical protein
MKHLEKFIGKDKLVYFSDKGDSMSNAQSFKGKCTQIMEAVKNSFEAAGATKETLHFDGKDVINRDPVKLTDATIEKFAGRDGEANALNGWFARAIEAKNLLMSAIKSANVQQFLHEGEQMKSAAYPEQFKLIQPRPAVINEETVISEWSANERAEFLIVEQKAAAIGKLIHKGQKLHEIYNTPLAKTSRIVKMASGVGSDRAYPVTIEPVYTTAELEPIQKKYLELHDRHRELEAKANWYKAKIHNQLTDMQAEAQRKYSAELGEFQKQHSEFNEKMGQWMNEVRTFNNQLGAKCEERRANLLKEASQLKIFIPEALRGIKTYVENFNIAKA